MAEAATITAESLRPDNIREDASWVTLLVKFGAKEARIEIPIGRPAFDREPGVEVYRRDLHELLEALSAWQASHGAITWPRRG